MFKFDPAQAKAYDQRGGYINEAGKYPGHIESAVWHVKNGQNGRSEGIFLNFVSDAKQKARFYINTSYHGGTVNEGGCKLIHAILACLRMRESGDPVPTPVKEYNPDTRQEETVTRNCFIQLHGKPLGIVVQMVHEDGRDNPSPAIYSVFEPASEMTASEILARAAEPVQLGKVMAYIAEKPLNDRRKSQTPPPPPPRQAAPQGQPVDDLDDSIPF
ncbi:MAG: hypothetical protein Q4A62_10640 [Eikenella sp.]|nr:hypothetical protein [Eikenella sp.]